MERLNRDPGALTRLRTTIAGSVRHKLLTLVLAPLLLGVPVLLLLVWVWGTQGYDRLMVNKVSADLGTANEFFDRVQSEFSTELYSVSQSHRLVAAMDSGSQEQVIMALANAAEEFGLDYLLLIGPDGQVLAGLPSSDSGNRGHWPVVRSALAGAKLHGLEVFSAQDLEALSPDLRRRAHLTLVSTPLARGTDRQAEDRGLMLTAAAPVLGDDGKLRAVVEGGQLLNGNLGIVDRLNALVYRDETLPDGSEGAATLFLDDVRVATSVRLWDGQRALGTRVSQAVYDKVMVAGQAWMGAAQVVNRSYISGYMPLTNVSGERVGMLYVGFLEKPLRAALFKALAGIFVAFMVVSVLGSVASVRWARSIFLPLERMHRAIALAEEQDESARVGPVASTDELGHLARAFDRLLDSLSARRAELQSWASELDRKVAERTTELENANETLKRAQQQLVMNEKLSAIGELTAGVAHEINNPVAVIQGNLDLIKEVLGGDIEPVKTEIQLIDDQISRIQVIVNKLLQFARPGDFAGHVDIMDVNACISDSLVLTRHNLRRSGVEVETVLNARSSVEMNRVELQQVLINLIVNALQAMPDGGTLTLETRDTMVDDKVEFGAGPFQGVAIQVRDTGQGIPPDILGRRIFDPFFTTKKQRGTGLGLSISYAIIQRYGGGITVESQLGQGTCFTIWLRRDAQFADPPQSPAFSSQFPYPQDGG